VVEPCTQVPEVCELPTEFQPDHELPPSMSTTWAWAVALAIRARAAERTMVESVRDLFTGFSC
jgi:hypothetical protein